LHAIPHTPQSLSVFVVIAFPPQQRAKSSPIFQLYPSARTIGAVHCPLAQTPSV
jgi:hypothetical protein